MKSEFLLIDAICAWCEKGTRCVEVEMDSGTRLDLCWQCLRKKAQNAHRVRTATDAKSVAAKAQPPTAVRAERGGHVQATT